MDDRKAQLARFGRAFKRGVDSLNISCADRTGGGVWDGTAEARLVELEVEPVGELEVELEVELVLLGAVATGAIARCELPRCDAPSSAVGIPMRISSESSLRLLDCVPVDAPDAPPDALCTGPSLRERASSIERPMF
ncbi:MAG: hypothetical protein QM516_01595 [Limnohabitans sp.]|nr:hypothetical protein [Limnohabitans sp.]